MPYQRFAKAKQKAKHTRAMPYLRGRMENKTPRHTFSAVGMAMMFGPLRNRWQTQKNTKT